MTIQHIKAVATLVIPPANFVPYEDINALYKKKQNAIAFANLGSKYENGIGVFTNYVSAYMWYFIAEHKGNLSASIDRRRISAKLTAHEIVKAQMMARQCLPS